MTRFRITTVDGAVLETGLEGMARKTIEAFRGAIAKFTIDGDQVDPDSWHPKREG